MKRSTSLHSALLAVTLATATLAAPTVRAAPVTRFEPSLAIQDAALVLNGSGTRFRAVFRVYDMALYTPRKVGSAEDLLALPGPKRLQFVALRELPGTDLGRLFIKGMSENSPKELVQKHTLSSMRLIEVFSGRNKMAPGETFAMEFAPGKGTTFFIMGQPQGAPVGDAEFFNMVLKIWVGPQPADAALRDALLGHERSAMN